MTTQQVSVQALDHCVVPVMDLWRSERFYCDALGGSIFQKVGLTFEEVNSVRGAAPPGAFIKLGANHIGLFLQNRTPVQPPASLETGCPCLGLEVDGDLSSVAEQVRAAGGTVGSLTTASVRGVNRRMLRCLDSEGNCLELMATGTTGGGAGAARRISHLHFESLDLPATTRFYATFLGAELVDEDDSQAVVAFPSDQRFVFHRVEQLSPGMVGPFRGRHFAFHVTDAMFHSMVARLHEAGIPEGDVRGAEPGGQPYVAPRVGDELGTYMNDPNGIRLQLINENSIQAAANRPMLRYAPA